MLISPDLMRRNLLIQVLNIEERERAPRRSSRRVGEQGKSWEATAVARNILFWEGLLLASRSLLT
jgi:hypothetical protein